MKRNENNLDICYNKEEEGGKEGRGIWVRRGGGEEGRGET